MPLEVLLSAEQIRQRVSELADQISAEPTEQPLLLISVLKGSFHFVSDLGRSLTIESEIDFMQISSYGSGKSSTGVVQIRKDLDINIEGRDVLIVEDIIDTGITLSYLRELLSTRSPRSIRIVSLLSKPETRQIIIPVEYIGFEIPNEFVVGYGLDFAEKYRNLPFVAILRGD